MSFVVSCGNGHRIQVGPQHQGKRVRCPMCQSPVDVPAGGPAPPGPQGGFEFGAPPGMPQMPGQPAPQTWGNDPYQQQPRYEEQPMEPPTEAELDQLELVSLGLGFAAWHYLFFIVALAFATIASLMFVIQLFQQGGGPFIMFLIFAISVVAAAFMLIVTLVLGFIGSAMCRKGPQRAGGGGLLFASMFLDCLFPVLLITIFVLAIIGGTMPPMHPSRDTVVTIRTILVVVLLVTLVLSHLFSQLALRGLRRFLQYPGGVTLPMILWLVALGGGGLIVGLEVLIMSLANAFPITLFRVVFFTLIPFLIFGIVANIMVMFLASGLRRRANALLSSSQA